MKCELCNETEIEGEIAAVTTSALSETREEEVVFLPLMGTACRNHIICEFCNRAVCHNCCSSAKSGYCDVCIERYNLLGYMEEIEEEYL